MFGTKEQAKILIVDDIPGNIEILAEILRDDYQVFVATNGLDALETASSEQPNLILLDVVMPEMDGYTVCSQLKADNHTKKIPIVFVTANTDSEHIVRGIEAGAFYYLTKPVNPKLLRVIVKAAIIDTSHHPYVLDEMTLPSLEALLFMDNSNFRVRTLDDVLKLSYILSEMCPEPERSIIGLRELLINAVEHGSLGITYEEKSALNENDQWEIEIERRQALPEYRNKYVVIRFQRMESKIQFLIRDEGPGFDWKSYLTFSPKRAFDSHGRGIAMAKHMGFDWLEYQGIGNEVLAEVWIG